MPQEQGAGHLHDSLLAYLQGQVREDCPEGDPRQDAGRFESGVRERV